ncbi:MAG: type II toxin-antitoxin system PemK/MazF family toxin [Frankiaceae bacterium]|nr:type II toxin-antitoxin system PemK/MazF family toxin [Frankiaceae bacterium]
MIQISSTVDASPSVVQVVPLTSALRGFASEVEIEADLHNGLDRPSSAQCQHIRAVAAVPLGDPVGNVGTASLAQIREVLGLILDVRAAYLRWIARASRPPARCRHVPTLTPHLENVAIGRHRIYHRRCWQMPTSAGGARCGFDREAAMRWGRRSRPAGKRLASRRSSSRGACASTGRP